MGRGAAALPSCLCGLRSRRRRWWWGGKCCCMSCGFRTQHPNLWCPSEDKKLRQYVTLPLVSCFICIAISCESMVDSAQGCYGPGEYFKASCDRQCWGDRKHLTGQGICMIECDMAGAIIMMLSWGTCLRRDLGFMMLIQCNSVTIVTCCIQTVYPGCAPDSERPDNRGMYKQHLCTNQDVSMD